MKKIAQPCFVLFIVICMVACNKFGDKKSKGHVEVYYKESISAAMAQRTADFIFEVDSVSHNPFTPKSFQLLDEKDTIRFRMVADKKKLDETMDNTFIIMANLFSDSLYNHRPVNIELTDRFFKTFKSIPFTKINLDSLQ